MRAASPHPEVRALLDRVEAMGLLPVSQYGAEGARELLAELRPDVEGPTMAEVTDRTVPGYDGGPEVPVRVYRPEGQPPFPTVVYLHGGGWVLGDLDGADLLCRHLAERSSAVVVSVDYRLAPEHPFPAAVEDAAAATAWAAGNPDPLDGDGPIAVAGASAGGNLAAAVSLWARDSEGPDIDYQLLVYPVVSSGEGWASREEFATGYYLEAADMAWFGDCYVGSGLHYANPYLSVLEAADHEGLPPATVVTAGFDPVRDEGVAYADALEAAGVPVTHRHYDDVIHAFLGMLAEPTRLERAHEALDDVAGDLRDALG